MTPPRLRLGTRGSLLARTQSGMVAHALEKAHRGIRVELVTIHTTGDRITDRPLAEAGGKGLFTKELELALLANKIDFAVHSLKDVPVTMPLVDQDDLIIASFPAREIPRDVLVSLEARSLEEMSPGMKIGTGSPRRRCQILHRWPELLIEPLRGNVDTRLQKLAGGTYDAVILALAGIRRVGRFDAGLMFPIDPAIMLPAAGQGALALQCRRSDDRTRSLLAVMNDPLTEEAVAAERAVVTELGGDCHSPIAALAVIESGHLTLRAAVGARDGNPPVIRADATLPRGHAPEAAKRVCDNLKALGVERLLGPRN